MQEITSSDFFKPLPPVFMLQMDNSAKDNKNVHVLAFCSELVIRGVFETVEVNFLMVEHMHEDIDALFSKVSAQTINKDVLTIPALMAEIWDSKKMHPVPLLLEEVADYKSYVDHFLGPLVGHSQPLGFRFSMANNVPIYRCLFTVDGPWWPEEGHTLWKKEDDDAFEAEIPKMIWLGRAMGAVMQKLDDEHHGQFLVEWWRPKHRKSTNATNKERYSNVLVGAKDWEKDPGYFTPQWINATAAIYSWKYRSKEGDPVSTKLNPLAKAAIESHFQLLDLENGVRA
ncbi:hypothetical protein R1sor_014781 [Riccia sorocarpa]|uniref:DUF7869 domain-containing protein n=1 Tax=Riccia sorocarpa TaxID=122646 RepID=A0ABD3HAD3_9MARC